MDMYGSSSAVKGYHRVRQSADALYGSMARLSSGERINRPGDAPADYGISEMLRFQIRNTDEAKRNIEKAQGLMNTADTWLQSVQDILHRMSEVSISATDASKSTQDRESLNAEFMQLKEEIGRISQEGKYNGLPVVGRDQLLTYDTAEKTFVFSNLDGSEKYPLQHKFMSGMQSENGLDYNFDGSQDFTISGDGKYIYYTDGNNYLNRYDIESDSLARDGLDVNTKAMNTDEKGNLWYAKETAPGSGTYLLRQQNIETWKQDTTQITDTDIIDMDVDEFSVYDNEVYYVNTAGDYVKRGLNNVGEVDALLKASDFSLNLTQGQLAISEDGKYLADISSPGVLRVINAESKKSITYAVDSSITPDQLNFSVESNELLFVNTTDNSIYSVGINQGEQPTFHDPKQVLTGGTYAKLNVDGGSHRANLNIHQGPDSGQHTFVVTGDVRLNTLGLAKVSVETLEQAKEATKRLQLANDMVSVQRAVIGAEMSRLGRTHDALADYSNKISEADSVIRDVDIAKESAEMLDAQVRNQIALSVLAQANSQGRNVVSLLNQ